MTVEQIAKEAMQLQRGELLQLLDHLKGLVEPNYNQQEIEKSWTEEATRRVEEIENVKVRLIPWEQVNAEAKSIIGR